MDAIEVLGDEFITDVKLADDVNVEPDEEVRVSEVNVDNYPAIDAPPTVDTNKLVTWANVSGNDIIPTGHRARQPRKRNVDKEHDFINIGEDMDNLYTHN